ncbi:AAA family ATPase [Streptomyces nojiriensis]|uniref:AAA family ATPase n=1 Tax=Streptomyces nojiriensis TaxID=66374 RepID=UPI0035D6DC12
MRAWCGLAAEAAARGWAADVRECRWTNTFRTHRRLASRDGRRRVLLIGDAAHVCSPIGGQGLNLGLRDAVSLAEVLPAATTAAGGGGAGGGMPTVLAADRLLGRDEELARLATAADRARGGRAQVVVVCGEAGIGKSSLLDAAVRQLPEQGWLVGSGHCPETDGAPPGRAWFDMLPGLAEAAPPGPYADELAPLLAPGTERDSGQPDGSPPRRFRLHRALLGWLRDTARRRPLAIVLDDLHRGDQENIELFLLCAEQLRDVPLLLVGSYRTGEGDLTGALARLAVCSPVRMALGGLSDAQAKELLRRGRHERARRSGSGRAGRGQPLLPAREFAAAGR